MPTIHVADAQFFRQVQEEIDRADLVLTEGVGDSSALAPTRLLVAYLFANYARWALHGDLAVQHEVLRYGENAASGDLTRAEFAAQMPWYAPLVHVLVAPVIVAGSEVHNAVAFALGTLSVPLGGRTGFEAGYRQLVYPPLAGEGTEPSAEVAELLLPGVVEARNARLLEVLDEALAERARCRICVPWGVAHMPGLAAALEERGFQPAAHRWLCAVRVRTHGDLDADEAPVRATDFYIPYLIQWRSLDGVRSLGLACESIHYERSDAGSASCSLLWNILFSWARNDRAERVRWQLLFSLFERPLLIGYERRGSDKHVRFLLLGRVSWTD